MVANVLAYDYVAVSPAIIFLPTNILFFLPHPEMFTNKPAMKYMACYAQAFTVLLDSL